MMPSRTTSGHDPIFSIAPCIRPGGWRGYIGRDAAKLAVFFYFGILRRAWLSRSHRSWLLRDA
jgi:hypothetical protein